MVHIIKTKQYKPKYYNPAGDLVITGDHVACFYGSHMARMLSGFSSVAETWSTRESITCIGAVKESMPRYAFIDMHHCMHLSDDWDDDDWDDTYSDEKYNPSPDVEHHHRQFKHIEDGFNKQWKEVVKFGRWITADEPRVAGWYSSAITIGPEPKPIRTGATIHSICVTLSTEVKVTRVWIVFTKIHRVCRSG
jgi:hypothetical protein